MSTDASPRIGLGPSRAAAWVGFAVAALATVGMRLLPPAAAAGAIDPTSQPLVQQNNLVYVGAFRLPEATSLQHTFDYGGTALTYWPAHDSLLVVGHDWYQEVAEVSIPTPGTGTNVADLPRAALRQPLTDILQGKRLTIDGDTSNGVKIGGILPVGDKLVVTAWSSYDAAPPQQTRSHFVTGQEFAALTPADVRGPFQVGTGYSSNTIAGFVSGYMTAIPAEWQSALGGTALTGQGGYVAVVGRTSSGPSANVFTPDALGVTNPTPATKVMGYPIDHATLGQYNLGGGLGLYNGTQGFRGMVFPDGTRSVLFFGWGGSRFCYGSATPNPALDFQPVPEFPDAHYCYDPTSGGSKGVTGYPYTSLVYAYDVNDLIAAKNGTKLPWEVVPYATWQISLPFQARFTDLGFGRVDVGVRYVMGATYDPATRRLFVTTYQSDGMAPLVHVFTVNSAAVTPGAKRLCF